MSGRSNHRSWNLWTLMNHSGPTDIDMHKVRCHSSTTRVVSWDDAWCLSHRFLPPHPHNRDKLNFRMKQKHVFLDAVPFDICSKHIFLLNLLWCRSHRHSYLKPWTNETTCMDRSPENACLSELTPASHLIRLSCLIASDALTSINLLNILPEYTDKQSSNPH